MLGGLCCRRQGSPPRRTSDSKYKPADAGLEEGNLPFLEFPAHRLSVAVRFGWNNRQQNPIIPCPNVLDRRSGHQERLEAEGIRGRGNDKEVATFDQLLDFFRFQAGAGVNDSVFIVAGEFCGLVEVDDFKREVAVDSPAAD